MTTPKEMLELAERALEQAQDCINRETPEDMAIEEARLDTISKIREALRAIAESRQAATHQGRHDLVEVLRNYIPGENQDDVAERIAEAATEIERLRALIPAAPQRREALPPVQRIEMVRQVDFYEVPSDPVWRVEVSGICADFPTETAANNFRNAILALTPAVAPDGAGEALIEQVAQWLHDETDDPDSFPGYAWPLHPNDTGRRSADGWVHIVPIDVVEEFRATAKRLVARFGAALAQAQEPGEEKT